MLAVKANGLMVSSPPKLKFTVYMYCGVEENEIEIDGTKSAWMSRMLTMLQHPEQLFTCNAGGI